jgi:hypothetical protein
MLDLSAAFDVIDHDILFDRLQYSFDISGSALSWIRSYLTDRSQCVSIGSVHSDNMVLKHGVPQGSVLGLCALERKRSIRSYLGSTLTYSYTSKI